MWLVLALAGYAILAVVSILDKFILTKEKVSPLRFVFYSCVFVLPILLLIPWVKIPDGFYSWLVAILAGIGFMCGLWTMYLGIEKSEISHIGPLVGATTPLFVLVFGQMFLSEAITLRQIYAILFLVVGSLVIASEYAHKKHVWHLAMGWGIVAAFCFAVSHVASKYLYDTIGFSGGFVWSRGFIGIAGLLLLLYPPLWKELRHRSWISRNHIIPRPHTNWFLVGTDKILGVTGVVLIQYATAIGSVTIVNALAGVQFAFLLIFIFILSRFFRQWFHEEYSRAEIIQEIISVVFIGLGLVLLL